MTDSEDPKEPNILELGIVLEAMVEGSMELQGLMPWSSNYTFLGSVTHQHSTSGINIPIIYKPQLGERPLWDFPEGTLYKREIAAYVISSALGWNLVPPTVARSGEHGIGSVQLFIHADYDEHYFILKERGYNDQFRRMALFDIIINNADRKGGHVLIDDDEHIWAIDHGIAFHDEYKLRTVLWDWVGQPFSDEEQSALTQLHEQLQPESALVETLNELLYPREIKAIQKRLTDLRKRKKFPPPHSSRAMPWPPV